MICNYKSSDIKPESKFIPLFADIKVFLSSAHCNLGKTSVSNNRNGSWKQVSENRYLEQGLEDLLGIQTLDPAWPDKLCKFN